jgi:hypothetical protein
MRFRIALGFALVMAVTALAAPRWTGDPVAGARELEAQWALVADAGRAMPIRGVLRFAVEATGLGWHPERVEAALARARALQDLDPASKTFGNFKWSGSHNGVQDLNAVEFASQLMGFMRARQTAQLSVKARSQLDEMMADAIAGLRSHVVRIEYTNIFVMKAWGLIAIGEALGRPEVAADGYRRFDEWIAFTARHGIGEYGAVVYYGIDLDSLAMIARLAGRADARAKAERAIRLVWTDLAANWWAPGDRMGGANSRTYDYLFGHGYTEAHTWTAGWLRERPELEGAGWLGGARNNLTTLREAVRWPPPAEWTEPIRAQVPRTVVQRWGDRPEHVAVNWIGRGVSLASSGASRSRDERTRLAGGAASDAVYGRARRSVWREESGELGRAGEGAAPHAVHHDGATRRGGAAGVVGRTAEGGDALSGRRTLVFSLAPHTARAGGNMGRRRAGRAGHGGETGRGAGRRGGVFENG